MSSRHVARSIAMQCLYQWDIKEKPTGILPAIIENTLGEFSPDMSDNEPYIVETVNGVIDHIDEINDTISSYASNWPLEQITLVDRNILRVGIYEMKYNDKIPARVAINEAIEIAKTYGGPSSGKFVNGILGSLYNDLLQEGVITEEHKENKKEPQPTA